MHSLRTFIISGIHSTPDRDNALPSRFIEPGGAGVRKLFAKKVRIHHFHFAGMHFADLRFSGSGLPAGLGRV